MKATIRGFLNGVKRFEESIEIGGRDNEAQLVKKVCERHALMTMAGVINMIEVDFYDGDLYRLVYVDGAYRSQN